MASTPPPRDSRARRDLALSAHRGHAPRGASPGPSPSPSRRSSTPRRPRGSSCSIAAALALVWANSPWSATYEPFWRTVAAIRVGVVVDRRGPAALGQRRSDGAVLPRRRARDQARAPDRRAPRPAARGAPGRRRGRRHGGPGADLRRAERRDGHASHGWGVPMATDIAFALGVLTLAAARAPSSLKPFLLTLAIVDDIGAIVVIAVFYSTDVDLVALLGRGRAARRDRRAAAARRPRRRSSTSRSASVCGSRASSPACTRRSPASSLGLLTPAVPFQRPSAVSEEAVRTAEATEDDPEPPDADAPQWLRLASLSREAVSPLARVEAALHPWTSFVIVPLFALANAGVTLSADAIGDAVGSPVTLGILAGLVVGKVVGIVGASRLAVALRVGRLPDGRRGPRAPRGRRGRRDRLHGLAVHRRARVRRSRARGRGEDRDPRRLGRRRGARVRDPAPALALTPLRDRAEPGPASASAQVDGPKPSLYCGAFPAPAGTGTAPFHFRRPRRSERCPVSSPRKAARSMPSSVRSRRPPCG